MPGKPTGKHKKLPKLPIAGNRLYFKSLSSPWNSLKIAAATSTPS
jgi:hypothetical protein